MAANTWLSGGILFVTAIGGAGGALLGTIIYLLAITIGLAAIIVAAAAIGAAVAAMLAAALSH